MRLKHLIVITALAAGLAGCFTSDKPLVSDAMAVAPYEKITFRETGSDKPTTAVREGKAYVTRNEGNTLALRFAPLEENLYVVEATGDDGGEVERLYALMKLDLAAGTATTYKAVAGKDDVAPGLRQCEKNTVCIDSLDAYVAYARAAIDAGAKADGTYQITVE